ncbi:plasma membrane protein [Colletotrichum musicola]|uniref:Plasma membrane protein n=1 Tax=Colletotrichum musicola TaxID=2175873 RepID=A0A8H6K4G5_9PEZI|nr:plasma membrane protein [Colletotrichum musicola]
MYLDYGNGPQIVRISNITATNGTIPIEGTAGKENLVTVIWAVNLTAFILVGLLVPLRVIVRCTVTRNFFSDDVLVIIAALFTFGICSLLPIATDLGLGQHYWNLDLEVRQDDTRDIMMLMFIANALYPCAMAFARLSAICSFLRFVTHKTMRYTMYGAAGITVIFGVGCVFAVLFQCKPIAAAWDKTIDNASCYPFYDYLHASTIINVALDIVLCTVPLPYLWKIKWLRRGPKIALTVLFLFNGLACAAAIVKVAYLQLLKETDVTYNWVTWVLCSIAESTVGIVCISIPPIVPLVEKCCGRRRRSTRSGPRRGRSLRSLFPEKKPARSQSVGSRVIRPMATPWKDQPVEKTAVPDFYWLRLEQEHMEFSRCWDRSPQSTKADQILGIAL